MDKVVVDVTQVDKWPLLAGNAISLTPQKAVID